MRTSPAQRSRVHAVHPQLSSLTLRKISDENDIQRLFEQHRKQIDQHSGHIKQKIDSHFEELISALAKRKRMLHKQVDVWKSDKNCAIDDEIASAGQCDSKDPELEPANLSTVRGNVYTSEREQGIAEHINAAIRLIDVEFASQRVAISDVCKYGALKSIANRSSLSVPTLHLLKPIKLRENKLGYRLKLKWTASHRLDEKQFIIQCAVKNDNGDADEADACVGDWKSLKCAVQTAATATTATDTTAATDADAATENVEYETLNIAHKFSFDTVYTLRVEYPMTEPVRLCIASNVRVFGVEEKPPQSSTAEYIELQCVQHRGHSYHGHPRNLLSDDEHALYRSRHNVEFDFGEHDLLVLKVTHATESRVYLPKAVLIRNGFGVQAVKRLAVSIGECRDGDVWYKYQEIVLENDGVKYQQCMLSGVDWKACKSMKQQFIKLQLLQNFGECRGQQCRFKMHSFQLYGHEF